ncbi:hemerythrin domain-containing protein [Roseivivax sediminis]|uniref:Hemerythrin HHE cation binding domain-containing protein n=1 Tax=Roseivivax sediminis TaxID=936889 RepID=A0A1I2DU05_9RHOB|nr:hemerythrin domain-containing protein [Roseivivax sediminis]SFE83947.1 Hemerythrin HHE cation binding domain-containing protein [Roseivivax sediminis]
MDSEDDLALGRREGLPDALRALLEAYPRDSWEAHPGFGGLVEFWLERHLMFRKLCAMLREDAEGAVDGRLAPETQQGRLARYGTMLVNELHGHHQIEDHHYFPALSGLEPQLVRGFTLLDGDHHAMDGLLDRFAKAGNAVLQGQGEVGPFREEVLSFEAMLDRHLVDEEELIVPVILKHGAGGLQ